MRVRNAKTLTKLLIFLALGSLMLEGCGRQPVAVSMPVDAAQATPSPAAAIPEGEYWDVMTARGTRIGYGRTLVEHDRRDGQPVLRISGTQQIQVMRFNETTQQRVTYSSLETPDGRLLDFTTVIDQGSAPQETHGRVASGQLQLETSTKLETSTTGKVERRTLPWPDDHGGLFAMEASLLRQPMQPGEQRTVHGLMIELNEPITVALRADKYETVALPRGPCELLRIETVTRFSNQQQLPSTIWCDRTGDLLKTRIEALGLESYRATKVEALQKTEPGQFDLGWDLAVKTDQPIPDAHRTRRIRYRVTLEDGDPAAVFVSGASQQCKSLDPHTAEITVYAIRPGQPDANPTVSKESSTADDLSPNGMIQSDDPRLVQRAREAAGGETDPWKTAVKLEAYVHRTIKLKDFSQAFATAAEVAAKPEGDCTEHAVFLAGLLRARGIPARVAMGLVYMNGSQSFGYHMWTEALIDGRWTGLDGTLAQGGIGAAHLKLAQSNLKGASAYLSMLPVLQVAGRLKIHVEEIE